MTESPLFLLGAIFLFFFFDHIRKFRIKKNNRKVLEKIMEKKKISLNLKKYK